ncbi:hypothetical protein ACFWY6_22490 [Streptomyces sp. NPDC059037]|uniref:hypothetical protein n=1 Tax=Streptomyces sp. NPDC059037 TaxID=3346710 RepID=UPI0036CC8D80
MTASASGSPPLSSTAYATATAPRREPGLPDAAGSGERHEAGLAQQCADLTQFTHTPDESGDLQRQFAGRLPDISKPHPAPAPADGWFRLATMEDDH